MKIDTIDLLISFLEPWRSWILLTVNGLLLFLLLFIAFHQGRTIFSMLKDTSFSNVILSKNIALEKEKNKLSIATWHLFGIQKQTTLKENSQWILKGIITDAKGNGNIAIIASSNVDEAIYRPGDKLNDGTIVLKILSNQVLLNRNGKTEALFLSWPLENQSVITRPNETPSSLGKPFTIMNEP